MGSPMEKMSIHEHYNVITMMRMMLILSLIDHSEYAGVLAKISISMQDAIARDPWNFSEGSGWPRARLPRRKYEV